MKPQWQQAPLAVVKAFIESGGKPFWSVKAADDDPKIGELAIYGPVFSESWWDDEISPGKIREQLEALGDVSQIKVFVNSPGGDAFAGTTIHNILKRHSAEVVVYIDGLAASAASVIAMAGDRVIMPRNAMIMVHNPWTIALGDSKELRQVADTLDQVGETLVATYKAKTDMSRRKLLQLMEAETWMGAEMAVELGFADEIEEDKDKAASASLEGQTLVMNGLKVDLSWFRNPPQSLAQPARSAATTTVSQAGVTVNVNLSLPSAAPGPPRSEPNNPPTADQQELVSLYAAKLRLNQNRRLA